MKKKIPVLFVGLITLMMLVTPLVSAVGARRNISQNFTATVRLCDPTTDPAGSYTAGITRYVGPKNAVTPPLSGANPEGRLYQLQSGSVFRGIIDCDQLGIGTMETTQLILLMNQETAEGSGMFKWKWDFGSKGTIEGIYKGEQKVEFPTMNFGGSALLCKGTGDLHNVKIAVTYEGTLDVRTFSTVGFSATIEGTMWGYNP